MKKGMAALFILGVFVFVLIIANIFLYFIIGAARGDAKNMFFSIIETNEEGKEMKALIFSEYGSKPYAELFGDVSAEGGNAEFSEASEAIMQTLGTIEKKCLVIYKETPDKPAKVLGECSQSFEERQVSDIPLPGARQGETKIKVKIE